MKVNIDNSDLKKVSNFFKELEMKDKSKILIASYRKALTPLVNTAIATAPKGKTLGLTRSLGMEDVPGEAAVLAGSKINTMVIRREGGKSMTGKVWYAHLAEMGSWKTGERHWKPRRLIRRGYYKGQYRGGGDSGTGIGKSTGIMPASHFWRDSLMATEDQAFRIAADEWYKEIDLHIRNSNKK